MRNERTPRTLAECNFDVGYPTREMQRVQTRFESFMSVLLACAMGIFFGVCYVMWWSQ
jgi:hypothetical protein